MSNVLNKIVVLLLLISVALLYMTLPVAILPIVIAVSLSCFMEYYESDKLNLFIFLIYIVFCLIYPRYLYFLPIMLYDLLFTRYQYFAFLSLIPVIAVSNSLQFSSCLILLVIITIELLLKSKSIQNSKRQYDYITQRDLLTEKSINLENKIRELTDKQDEEISLATLNERNRIAREIHDNVGHLLSSSIIQIGAIIATTDDNNAKEGLKSVSDTLNEGMNSIRSSVHNLRDNSIDLYMQLKTIADKFNFCNISFNYESDTNFDIKAKYAIISIVKEALNNVIKHSNATEVTVILQEHPKIVQLIIYDNGTNLVSANDTGMGIEGIKQRVKGFDGIINIDTGKGFRIFISFMKEKIV